jgi:HPt (histidine-containing phosphotransfer) domain-containing protein
MILLTNDAERAVKTLKKNYGNSETIQVQQRCYELEVIPKNFQYGGELVSNRGKIR